ncbi:hypothetical protein HaLaN_03096 [Haematococcus lacustris]|uniref:Uncharacterized protein n=1 Tax=Haematococcus lacustris TaxID=44745 RepID=A0A699YFX6_HAELA|nr:hypothetical protein HaLaN_03096 [Haematococcus lacustris]
MVVCQSPAYDAAACPSLGYRTTATVSFQVHPGRQCGISAGDKEYMEPPTVIVRATWTISNHAKCAYRSDVSPSLITSEITGALFSLHDTPGPILYCPVGLSLTPCSRPDEEVISRRREQGPAVAGPAWPASGTPGCSPEPA